MQPRLDTLSAQTVLYLRPSDMSARPSWPLSPVRHGGGQRGGGVGGGGGAGGVGWVHEEVVEGEAGHLRVTDGPRTRDGLVGAHNEGAIIGMRRL